MSPPWRCVRCRALADAAQQTAKPIARTHRRAYTSTARNALQSRVQESETVPPTVNYPEMSSLAHTELETHREIRQLTRIAAWEMPMLSSLSKPFVAPTEAVPLRWRYTTYFGELHPAANKVVVEFGVADLKDLTEEQRDTLRKIAGPRRDPVTDLVKMSCESFPSQAQNKRFLGDTIANLIKEAVEGADNFKDVPIDERHAAKRIEKSQKAFPVAKFPKEWYLSPERKAYLEQKRQQSWKDHEIYLNRKATNAPPSDERAAVEMLQQAGIAAPPEARPQEAEAVTVSAQATGSSDRAMISGLNVITLANQRAAASPMAAAVPQRTMDTRRPSSRLPSMSKSRR